MYSERSSNVSNDMIIKFVRMNQIIEEAFITVYAGLDIRNILLSVKYTNVIETLVFF